MAAPGFRLGTAKRIADGPIVPILRDLLYSGGKPDRSKP